MFKFLFELKNGFFGSVIFVYMEEKNLEGVEEETLKEKKETCCVDGSCSICQKRKKLEENLENFTENIKEEENSFNRKEIIVPDKIRAERERVAYAFSSAKNDKHNNYKIHKNSLKEETVDLSKKVDYFMTETEHKVHHKKYRENIVKKSSNKSIFFLIFLIILLLVAFTIASFYSYKYFNNFKDQVISKDKFDSRMVQLEDGKTWVRYDEKPVNVEVFYSTSCGDNCNTDDVTYFLQSQIPTLEIKKIDVDLNENNYDLTYVPFYVFDDSILETNFYSRSKDLFIEKNDKYIFDATSVGFPVGKYLTNFSEDNFLVGDKDTKVTVLAITDFSCESCAISHPILNKLEDEYKGKVKFVYKIVTDTEDEKLSKIGLATFCANDQDGFDAFSDIIFARQTNWANYNGDMDNVLENYAVSSKLNKADFTECMAEKKFEKEVGEMNDEIRNFGITNVPVYFINDKKVDGVVTYTTMKEMIDEALGEKTDSSSLKSSDNSN